MDGPVEASSADAQTAAPARQSNIVVFCALHPNADFPSPLFFSPDYKPGTIPEQIATLD